MRVYARLSMFALMAMFVIAAHGQVSEETVIAYWNLDEDTGAIAPDGSEFGNDATVVGNAKWVAGNFGGGLELAAGMHLQTTTANGYSPTYMSQSMWFNSTSLANENQFGFISAGGGGGVTDRLFYYSTWCAAGPPHNCIHMGTIDLAGGWGRGLVTGKMFDEKTWYHVAGVINNETGKQDVYVDGKMVFTQTFGAGDTPKDATFLVAGSNATGSNQLNGIIDEVAYFNVALTEDEVVSLMEDGLAQTLAVDPTSKVATTWAHVKTRR
ncbi:MAG: LamG domain-containing protein [Candidatus Poribacteria bacterium]|nr:LamG domain-containing protein [Candidatus Poribacteria bacterium]